MQGKDIFTLALAALGTILGLVNVWLGFLRRGRLQMTQPALVAFLYDPPRGEPKIFFRALLYSTGKRGQVIEGMFLKVRRGETSQTFNYWAYGEKSLLPGSGLRVGEEGVVFNHHFLPLKDGTVFRFLPGEYLLGVYANIVNGRQPVCLRSASLVLSEEQANMLRDRNNSVFFNWGPDSKCYIGHADTGPPRLAAGQQ